MFFFSYQSNESDWVLSILKTSKDSNAHKSDFIISAAGFLNTTVEDFHRKILELAIEKALKWLKQKIGKPSLWKWGEAHSVKFSHPFEVLY